MIRSLRSCFLSILFTKHLLLFVWLSQVSPRRYIFLQAGRREEKRECWLPAGRGRVNEKLQSQLNSPELDFPSQRQALMRWPLKSLLAPALTISWNLVTDLILPVSTCVLHHPTAKLINYFTACKEQPLTVTGPQPKWKKEKKIQPHSLCIANIFTEEYLHRTPHSQEGLPLPPPWILVIPPNSGSISPKWIKPVWRNPVKDTIYKFCCCLKTMQTFSYQNSRKCSCFKNQHISHTKCFNCSNVKAF